MQAELISCSEYGVFRCPFCTDDELVDADDSGHKHDGMCGDALWPDYLPERRWDDLWPTCPCCERRAELIEPLFSLVAGAERPPIAPTHRLPSTEPNETVEELTEHLKTLVTVRVHGLGQEAREECVDSVLELIDWEPDEIETLRAYLLDEDD